MTGSRSTRARVFRVVRYVLVLGIVVYVSLPAYWVLIGTIRPPKEIFESPPSWIPGGISFEAFGRLLESIPLGHYVANSLIVVGGTALAAVVVATLTAYALARFRFRLQAVAVALLLFAVTVPSVVVMVPFYLFIRDIGLLNTHLGLILSYSVWAIPFTALLLRGYLKSAYSKEIEEAALIDGCGPASVIWRIMLPLARPGIIAAAIVCATFAWNEYVWASIIVTGDAARTVPVGLQLFVGHYSVNASLQLWFAGALISLVPLLIAFGYGQSRLASAYGIVDV
jgi:ABC-type glycerol-3-phosphate transport system permease component